VAGAAGDGVSLWRKRRGHSSGRSAQACRPHPRHDYAFADRLANDLLQHFGEWRALPSLYAPGVPDRCEIVRDVIVRLKRLGFLIEGDRRLGYRLTGFHGFRYVHVVQALTAPVEPPDETTQPG